MYVNFSVYDLSEEIMDFCERNGISEDDIKKISESKLAKNTNRSSFNPLLKQYGVKELTSTYEEIYVRDIIGEMPHEDCGNVLASLEKSYSNHYDILEMSREEMLKSIKESPDVICLSEVKPGKYMVSNNGCHRASMLRFLYIDEVLKKEKPIEEIDEKYKIKAEINNYDLTLTYINYLLTRTGAIKGIYPGNRVKFPNDQEQVLTREQIIYSFNILFEQTKSNLSEVSLLGIEGNAKAIPSLNSFLKVYAPELAQKNELGTL